MLRVFAILLLVVNGLFFAWSNGYLNQLGLTSMDKSETFRLSEQIEPQRIVIKQKDALITPMDAKTQALATPTTCLTAGTFNDIQSNSLKQVLSSKLPDLRWRFDAVNTPARWIVYMGKYPNNATRDLKKSQLNQIKVRYEVLTEGNLEPGLSLGSHATQAAANLSLQQLFKQGVRTARVLQESSEQKAQILVVPAVDETNIIKLKTVYATIASQLSNKTLQACK